MNTRLKELYEQASTPPCHPDDQGSFDVEKFAELIILECANLFEDDGVMSSMAEWAHNNRVHSTILEHFGVNP